MRCSWTLVAAGLALSVDAFKVAVSQIKNDGTSAGNVGGISGVKTTRPKVLAVSDNSDSSLSTANDLIYIANISVGGLEYPVQLDTGSSDLWLKGPNFPLPNVSHTSTTFNLTYGIGWSFGNISTASVKFASLDIPSQALIDASSAVNPALGYGAQGILGLGFTSLSNIDAAINKTGGSWGRSLLYNAFNVNSTEPNFITFALQRSSDPTDEIQGMFTIGEVDPTYSAISNSPSIPTFPEASPKRWNVLLESVFVGTETIGISSNVSGAPGGNAVVLLDSGTSYTYCPTSVATAIYGGISGASFDPVSGLWNVPCNVEIDMALQFGGQVFPLHPLDISPPSSTNVEQCIGSFIPSDLSVGGGEFDWLIGDNVLRSVYGLYDFGDFDSTGKAGNPYVKLLSIVDPNNASAEFTAIRGGTPRTNITYNATPSSGSGGTVSVADSTADKLAKLADYMPIMLGILALNAIALLVIAIVAVVYLCRRSKLKRSSAKRRSSGLRNGLSIRSPTPYPGPMPASPMEAGGGGEHEYAAVAVHAPGEPEDQPFVPPEPSFQSYDGDSLRPLTQSFSSSTRPRSMFSMTSNGSGNSLGVRSPARYRASTAGSELTAFVPPSPEFKDAGRPKSYA